MRSGPLSHSTALLALLLPTVLRAQDPARPALPAGESQVPAGWTVRADTEAAGPARLKMEIMEPGWHLTTGPAAILYRRVDVARGAYRLQSAIHLFPGPGSRREAFGLFIGGKDLDAPTQRYTYFIIRGDGKFKIKRRHGAATSDVTDWKASPAIRQADPRGPVKNTLRIEVRGDRIRFLVNDQEVYAAPASALDTEGIAGLRVNHHLNLHVESLTLGG